MVILRGGRYRRGDLQGDGDLDEKPALEIRLQPFAIGMYEVTFGEYDRFCEATRRRKPDDSDWGRGRRPVVNISWADAQDFVRWLSEQAGDDPECGKRVIRGGAWSFPPREMRSANRWRDFPARSSDDTGLRLVRDLEPYP
jgi:formylglycine-generating enzyme required for sulfatase activity